MRSPPFPQTFPNSGGNCSDARLTTGDSAIFWRRMEFTVIGDAVNKTSRYCAAAKAGEVIVSPDLHQHVWKMAQAEAISLGP